MIGVEPRKLTEKPFGGAVICVSGFNRGGKVAKSIGNSVFGDARGISRFFLGNALEGHGAIGLWFAITHVFVLTSYPQVAAAIVQDVPVYVINRARPRRRDAENVMVDADVLSCAASPDLSRKAGPLAVEAKAPRCTSDTFPIITVEKKGVARIFDRDGFATIAHLYLLSSGRSQHSARGIVGYVRAISRRGEDSGDVIGGHAALSAVSNACAASNVRLSVGRSPVSKREMLDCESPMRSAISACESPSARRMSESVSMTWVYAHTHSDVK